MWAVRCVHEASLYENNCFITLTFSSEYLDSKVSLVKSDFQLFMKRLRKKFGSGIRFYHCGEYGSQGDRPHHHALLFNFDFPDKVLWTVRKKIPLYRSEILEELWPYGFCVIGNVTFESAAYVARYIMKKQTGKDAKEHYNGRLPEYNTMSRRPGIARDWFEKFKTDVYPDDFLVIKNGIKCKPPRYYDKIYGLTNPDGFDIIKQRRDGKRALHASENTPERLSAREQVQLARLQSLKRGYENGS
ncbi:replication protein VP4 [Gokushovirinae Bog1183_53]|uniref:replication protein VP4 n=1 Tax=Gokushovirinae Bog1183_53 TaxID=1655646 RepID=UPI00063D5A94|nr:replication protein VP4 [Gokushovirinae Bog1183_53]AKI26868.1 replication protein VP4 [Gokushovirinae Bog1183_53]